MLGCSASQKDRPLGGMASHLLKLIEMGSLGTQTWSTFNPCLGFEFETITISVKVNDAAKR